MWVSCSVVIAIISYFILRWYSQSSLNFYSFVASSISSYFVSDVYPKNQTDDILRWRDNWKKAYYQQPISTESRLSKSLTLTLNTLPRLQTSHHSDASTNPQSKDHMTVHLFGPLSLKSWEASTNDAEIRLYPVLLWIYDSSYVFEFTNGDAYKCSKIANMSNALVVAIEHRLAPEFVFPSALQDILSALIWMKQSLAQYGGDMSRLYIGGEGAGGTLATILVAVMRGARNSDLKSSALQAGLILPPGNMLSTQGVLGLFLVHPFQDGGIAWNCLACDERSQIENMEVGQGFWRTYRQYNRINPLFSCNQAQWVWRLYFNLGHVVEACHAAKIDVHSSSDESYSKSNILKDRNFDDMPMIASPYHLPDIILSRYPPTYVLIPENDVLFDENIAWMDRLKLNQVRGVRKIYNGSMHSFLGMRGTAHAEDALSYIAQQIK